VTFRRDLPSTGVKIIKQLYEHCVYTIALPGKLVDASRKGAPLPEARQWVTGARLWQQARDSKTELPVLFADSRDCSKLIAWSILKSVRVRDSGTRYTIGKLWKLEGRKPQHLRLRSSGKRIAAGFIRPYALCHTPDFVHDQARSPRPFRYKDDGGKTGSDRAPKRKTLRARKRSRVDAKAVLHRAWPVIVRECRGALGSEQYYQAMVYHCLRTAGGIPLAQFGMNVKIWIDRPVSKFFRELDQRKNEDFRGGFEPIPDVVIFSPGIRGDWRRRNNEATLRYMIGAIEIKVSERAGSRLRPGEVKKDIEKLAALRQEKKHRWKKGIYSAVMVVDTAEPEERMTEKNVEEVKRAAAKKRVAFFYLSRDVSIPVI
jgi:hypothetical protein